MVMGSRLTFGDVKPIAPARKEMLIKMSLEIALDLKATGA